MNKLTSIIILIFLLFGCVEKPEKKKTTELVKENSTLTSQKMETEIEKSELTKECECFDGIGSTKVDKPILTFSFLNKKSISVCGFYDKDLQDGNGIIISEFNVFDCSSGKSYIEYDATQTCRIKETQNSIVIEELYYLPTGKDWTWELIQIAEQTISSNENEILVSEIKPKIKPIKIDVKVQTEFLDSIKKGQEINGEWELEIGKLVATSLSGNENAWSILKDYENYTGEKTDGALAETWKDAVSLVEWIKNK